MTPHEYLILVHLYRAVRIAKICKNQDIVIIFDSTLQVIRVEMMNSISTRQQVGSSAVNLQRRQRVLANQWQSRAGLCGGKAGNFQTNNQTTVEQQAATANGRKKYVI